MANINLPFRLKSKIELNQHLDGIVKTTISDFGEILEENKLFFFEEYTDHGIKHIESILNSTDNLITQKTFDHILQHTDISFYVLSVILHDIGMHISTDGFLSLLNGNFDDAIVKEFDALTWNELWSEFLKESMKFSGKQLKSIFGDENLIIRVPPLSDRGRITENDKKLIGEFLRRNHSRLAHEIALKGFPGNPHSITFAEGLDLRSRNLVGLVARSHGMGLRKCIDYLERTYGKENRRHPSNCHVIYLMVLIRIADYIQIDNSRIYKKILKTRTFSNPISELEHNSHLAIEQIEEKYLDDPERLFVEAFPKDSKMYFKIKELLNNIQNELDISWAVLGEIYGLFEHKPEIKYRRITSNLETELFISNQEYIPDYFAFKANDEITRLLISPLYGNDPKYGFRELLQNSLDACKEREEIEKRNGNNKYKPVITIEIDKDKDSIHFVQICDNGIGMDLNIIKNYFLCAGASYRKSLEWKKQFVDKKGRIKVRRNGRFGIGVLASFLIGNEILVETRHLGNETGYLFKVDLNTEQINVIKSKDLGNGTKIKIITSEETINKLRSNEVVKLGSYLKNDLWYNWYTFSNPQVKYRFLGKEIIAFSTFDPDLNEELPIKWNSINSKGFNKIFWTYSNHFAEKEFTCNGIVISNHNLNQNFLDLGLITNFPKISVFDNEANLPLTLDRNSLTDILSFSKDLKIDIYKDFIAYILCIQPFKNYVNGNTVHFQMPFWHTQSTGYNGLHLKLGEDYSYPYGTFLYSMSKTGRGKPSLALDTILVSKSGFILNYNFFIKKLGGVLAVLIQSENLGIGNNSIDLDIKDRFLIISNHKINSIEEYKIAIEPRQFDEKKGAFLPINARIFIKSEKYDFLFLPKEKRISLYLNKRCILKSKKNGWACLHLDDPKESLFSNEFLIKYSKDINFIREWEISCQEDGDQDLNALFDRYIGDDVIIPYSLDERKKKYPLAFKELEKYMKKYLIDDPTFMWDSINKLK